MTAPILHGPEGLDIERDLRPLARLYRQQYAPYILGAFGLPKENTVAEWLTDESTEVLAYSSAFPDQVEAAAIVQRPRSTVPVRDFTGAVRARIPAGAAVIRHATASSAWGWGQLSANLPNGAWLEGWAEDEHQHRFAEFAGLQRVATKIKASSELVGVWAPEGTPYVLPRARAAGPRAPRGERFDVSRAAAEVEHEVQAWADHYSLV